MSLIQKTIEATTNFVGFRANSAAEMAAIVTEWIIANPTLFIWDIQLVATGAAPEFLCTLTVGNNVGSGSQVLPTEFAYVTALGGVSRVDALAMVAELQAEVRATAPDSTVMYKAVSTGGGFGPHWMAIALRDGPAER